MGNFVGLDLGKIQDPDPENRLIFKKGTGFLWKTSDSDPIFKQQ